ncbi:MAG: guanylate kinase [Candidatus Taylorbacteria bacterium]|nr:guanylate kinase [Candidatus Taylorbacteria bacterium]
MKMKATLIVITGPSGVGKQSVIKTLRQMMDKEGISHTFSVSSTTRQPRPGEVGGVDYHFRTLRDFEEMVSWQQFLEHAKVHDNYYGTEIAPIQQSLDCGESVILDIDVQGATTVRQVARDRNMPLIDLFIAPPFPEIEILRRRLQGRGTDPEHVIEKRLRNATGELARKDEFTHVVINDELQGAAEQCLRHVKACLFA